MNVIVRADASIDTGTGHIMRCLTLSDELHRHNASIFFICREEKGNLMHLIREKGYTVHSIPSGINPQADSKATQALLGQQDERADWVVVDHYKLDAEWEYSMREYANNIMVIDDLADRRHDCDLLLDQNLSLRENRYKELVSAQCIQLIGPEYALLRPQFHDARKKLKSRSGQIKRILVFMGGADPDNLTCKVVKALQTSDLADTVIDIVIGPSNDHKVEIDNLVLTMPGVSCHYNVNNMAEMMVNADLGIGAGGTASWERCCAGLPGITLILAENQKDIAESLHTRGAVINLGWYDKVNESDIKSAVESLIKDPRKVVEMAEAAKDVVDGQGSARVARTLKEISVREV